jgi:hypothetical protein
VIASVENDLIIGVTRNGALHSWDLKTGAHARSVKTDEAGLVPRVLAPHNRWMWVGLSGAGKPPKFAKISC